MDRYPESLPICKGSRVDPVDSIRIDRATNNAVRGVDLATGDKHVIVLEHQHLDAAARAALDAFFSGHRPPTQFEVNVNGALYVCLFGKRPRYRHASSWVYADATVELVEA